MGHRPELRHNQQQSQMEQLVDSIRDVASPPCPLLGALTAAPSGDPEQSPRNLGL